MNVADWLILLVVLLSIVHAASSGFFQEAFGIAGLVFGYLIAAWGYRSLADHFGFVGQFAVAGADRRISGDLSQCDDRGWNFGPNRSLDDEGSRTESGGPGSGRRAWPGSRMFAGGDCSGEHDRVHPNVALAARFESGAVLPGGGEGGDVGSALRVAGEVLRGTGLRAQSADAGHDAGASSEK